MHHDDADPRRGPAVRPVERGVGGALEPAELRVALRGSGVGGRCQSARRSHRECGVGRKPPHGSSPSWDRPSLAARLRRAQGGGRPVYRSPAMRWSACRRWNRLPSEGWHVVVAGTLRGQREVVCRAPRPVERGRNSRRRRRAERLIEERGLEVVRLSFPDQHGILRGKTIIAGDAARLMRNGCSLTTTLLAKDTSHKTVFPVFTAGGGFGMPEMEGGGDFLMIADPATFRVLPWAPKTGWVLCDIYFQNGQPVPFSTRHLYRRVLKRLVRPRLRLRRGARSRIPCVQDREPAARSRRRRLAERAAGGERAVVRLPVPHRDALRSTRADPGNRSAAISSRSTCRCARSRTSSGRANANSRSRRKWDWRLPIP